MMVNRLDMPGKGDNSEDLLEMAPASGWDLLDSKSL